MPMSSQEILQNPAATAGVGNGSATVTPNDGADLTTPARSLYCVEAGTVHFTGVDNVEDTWTVPANFIIPVAVKRVFSTGTTVTTIKAIR